MEEKVIIVNEDDQQIAVMEKLKAHQEGRLHRAFSVFIFNSEGELLLQKRARDKYHSGGLWSNTCCSHPRPGESITDAAARRLKEEMGINSRLFPLFKFLYCAELDGGLIEHEIDHVLIGFTNDTPNVNAEEAEDWKYEDISTIEKDLFLYPLNYTVWFRKCFHTVMMKTDELLKTDMHIIEWDAKMATGLL